MHLRRPRGRKILLAAVGVFVLYCVALDRDLLGVFLLTMTDDILAALRQISALKNLRLPSP